MALYKGQVNSKSSQSSVVCKHIKFVLILSLVTSCSARFSAIGKNHPTRSEPQLCPTYYLNYYTWIFSTKAICLRQKPVNLDLCWEPVDVWRDHVIVNSAVAVSFCHKPSNNPVRGAFCVRQMTVHKRDVTGRPGCIEVGWGLKSAQSKN